MKNKNTYTLHPDLKRFEKLRLGNVRLSRPVLALNNAMARVSVAFFFPPRNIRRRRFKISGYQDAPVALTIYEPKNLKNNAPCLVYFHGGGFISRDFGFLHNVLCRYAAATPCRVVLVNYRLAPRFPFPVGLEDCYAALLWVYANTEKLAANPENISVGGDSAGAALATACAQLSRDRGGPRLKSQLLLYPVTDMSLSSHSIQELYDCPGCNPCLLRQMWAYYLKNGCGGAEHYASPMHAKTLAGLPPAYIETQEFDSLKDEGLAYAEKLRADGVAAEHTELKGTFHAFDTAHNTSVAKTAVAVRVAFLKKHMYL